MAKTNESPTTELFEGIDTSAFEELIVVDTPAKSEEEIALEVGSKGEDTIPGDNEGNKKEEIKSETKPEAKKEEIQQEQFITVDVGKDKTTEIKTEEQQTEEDKKSGSASKTEGTESPIYLHAAALQQEGVLPNFKLDDIKELKPEEALSKINTHISDQITTSVKDGIDDYKKNLSQPVIDFLDKLEKGVPFEAAQSNATLHEQYGGISEKQLDDDEALSERIYGNSLRLKGFSDDKINKYVTRAKEDGEIVTEAKDGLKEINIAIKKESDYQDEIAKTETQKVKDNNKAVGEKIDVLIKDTKEIIPGMVLSDADKKDLHRMMTSPTEFIEKDGQQIPVSSAQKIRSEDPYLFEMRLNYFIKNGFFDKDADFGNLNKKLETNATKRLAKVFESGDKKISSVSSTIKDDKNKEGESFTFPSGMEIKI